MKLADALRIARDNERREGAVREIFLAVGFTPLHLATMLLAHAAERNDRHRVGILTGPYGDLAAALAAPGADTAAAVAVAVEWADLDPRLGLRRAGGWSAAAIDDAVAAVPGRLDAIGARIAARAKNARVAVSTPTLPLPPAFSTVFAQAGTRHTALRRAAQEFAAAMAGLPNVAVLNAEALDAVSPPAGRHHVAGELDADFPYTLAHADALAGLLADLAFPAPPLKGIITDLDDTLWRGLVGEAGAAGVRWDPGGHAQIHALYQQTLAALADQGILIAIASKNAPDVAEAALRRADILLPPESVFPMEIGWGRKSDSVARILAAWNVAADSVAFVDDSPLELAEVAARFPGIRAPRFTPHDAAACLALMHTLRDWCGKPAAAAEDRLRLASLRSGQDFSRAAAAAPSDAEFLGGLDARVTLDFSKDRAAASRPLELINKTNQFNLNGRRIAAHDWLELLNRPDGFVLTVSYTDKFGPLGVIAVAAGERRGEKIHIRHWVQSCRAFSRHIEHRTLRAVFELFPDTAAVTLDVAPTGRNAPLLDFLAGLPHRVIDEGTVIGRDVLDVLGATTAHFA